MEKYDRIGLSYNETRKADPYLVSRMVHWLGLPHGAKILDIGCGTGNYTIALQKQGFEMTGIDPSTEMLSVAEGRGEGIQWLQGQAEQIPLPDQSMDGALASLTIHHWQDLEKAFWELSRVLKANAPMVIFTSTSGQMKGYWLNAFFPQMLIDSMRQMPSIEEIYDALLISPFKHVDSEAYFVDKDLEDLFLYAGKDRPHLYQDPMVRKGISSFADLAYEEEVLQGLKRLQVAVESGQLAAIKEQYVTNGDGGDYLFVIARRYS